MHFCVAGPASCGGTSSLTTYICSSRSKCVCERMWPASVHLEQMHTQYERGRGLYALWVELSVMLAYAFLTDMHSHTGDCSLADLENVRQLIVRDLHTTLSSVQNPRSFPLSTALCSLDGCEQSPVCESISVREAIGQTTLCPQSI